jgi:multimeric flavodoxin WrbA
MGEHILVINGSPRAEKGITDVVINQFLAGCAEYGATSETVYASKIDLSACGGELCCYFTGSSQCQVFRSDAGNELARKWIAADRIVLASPLHFNSVTSHLTRFLERLIPISDPLYIENDGTPTHKVPYAPKPSVVVGVCAYPGAFNFALFREVMLNYQKVFWLDPRGSLLVPMSRDLTVRTPTNPRFEAVSRLVAALGEAGREFMRAGEISPETQETVSADTDNFQSLLHEYDSYFVALNRGN